MEQFSLEKWLQDKSRKVCTREGNIVEIIYTNGKGPFPVIVIDPSEEETVPWRVTENGKLFRTGEDEEFDLFFADEEETLSALLTELKSYLANTPREQIEKDWKEIQDWYNQHVTNESNEEEELTDFESDLFTTFSDAWQQYLRGESVNVVGWAKEHSKELLESARKEILKDLPKWKKATENKEFDKHVLLFEDEKRVVLTTELYKGEYYIELSDLETLPKEE